jgi:hypothetical protein
MAIKRFGVRIDEHKGYRVIEPHETNGCDCLVHTTRQERARVIAEGYRSQPSESYPYDFVKAKEKAERRAHLVELYKQKLSERGVGAVC